MADREEGYIGCQGTFRMWLQVVRSVAVGDGLCYR